jgi:hypothetical protein
MAVKLIGTDTAGGVNRASGYAYWSPYTATLTGICTSIKVYCRVNSNVRVAIYNNSGGLPVNLLNESASVAITAGAWGEITIPPTALVKDVVYWLAFQPQTTGGGACRSGGAEKYKAWTYGAFPVTAPSGLVDNTYEGSLQGWGNTFIPRISGIF